MLQEISDRFSFTIPNARFDPRVKNKMWDGRIRLLNQFTGLIYRGLVPEIVEFARQRGYDVVCDDNFGDAPVSEIELQQFLDSIPNLPFKPAPDQVEALLWITRKKSATILAPTGSGKSYIIYLSMLWFSKRTLIVVDSVGLVKQMTTDLVSYGTDPSMIHTITSGVEKNINAPIVISTWQSIWKLDREWFNKFGFIVGDEVHGFKAKSLVSLMSKTSGIPNRLGTTGTFDDVQAHEMVIRGLFGPVKRTATTAELINAGRLSKLQIKCIVLNYPEKVRAAIARNYPAELSAIKTNIERTKFIANLACSLKGNVLILFQHVETHGDLLEQAIKERTSRTVLYVHGGIDGDIREEYRQLMNSSTDNIFLASYGTSSKGINIPSITNVILASPSKAKIRILQSIGRSIRLHGSDKVATLYDIADNLSISGYENYTLKHFKRRIELYNVEDFDYKIYNVSLGE